MIYLSDILIPGAKLKAIKLHEGKKLKALLEHTRQEQEKILALKYPDYERPNPVVKDSLTIEPGRPRKIKKGDQLLCVVGYETGALIEGKYYTARCDEYIFETNGLSYVKLEETHYGVGFNITHFTIVNDEEPVTHDPVNKPAHYTDGKIEVIDFIEDKKLGYHLGNAIKYIARAGKKDPDKTVEDIKKARWYLDRAISQHQNNGDGKE